jgi:N-acetylglucosamine kinase-like BadF-type ATPase
MGERYVLGVDGGNTKTVAAVARLGGTIVGVGRGGCSDIYAADLVEATLEEVSVATSAALAGTDARREDLISGGFSMAGADWPEDIAFLGESLAARAYGGRITVINDAMSALRAGSTDGTGVAVVCGTGAAIGARASSERHWHTGW